MGRAGDKVDRAGSMVGSAGDKLGRAGYKLGRPGKKVDSAGDKVECKNLDTELQNIKLSYAMFRNYYGEGLERGGIMSLSGRAINDFYHFTRTVSNHGYY